MARGRGSSEFRLRLVAEEVTKASAEFQNFGRLTQESMDRLGNALRPVNDNLRKTDQAASGFKDQLRGIASNIAVLDGPLGGVASRFNALATAIGRVGLLWGGLSLGLAAGVFSFIKLTSATSDLERSMLRISNVLRASGNAAVVTVKEVNEAATTLARDTLTSIAEAREAAATVISSPNVENIGQVERILALGQDLTEVFGGSLKSNVELLGRAFDAPSSAFEILRRRGIALSASLKETVKDFEDSGQAARGAAVIFEELERRIGGAGRITGLPGAIDLASVEFERVIDLLGELLHVGDAAESVFTSIADSQRALGDAIESYLRPQITELEDDLRSLREERDRLLAPPPEAGSAEERRRLGEVFARPGILPVRPGGAANDLEARINEIQRQISDAGAQRTAQERAAQFELQSREVDKLLEQEQRIAEALDAVSTSFSDQREKQLERILESVGGVAGLGEAGVAEVTDSFEKAATLAEAEKDAKQQAAAIQRDIAQMNEEDRRAEEKFFAERQRALERAREEAERIAERFDDVLRSLEPEGPGRRLAELVDRAGGAEDLGPARVAQIEAALVEQIARETEDRRRERLSDRVREEGEAAQQIVRQGEAAFDRAQRQQEERTDRQVQRLLERLDPLAEFRRVDAALAERQGRAQDPEAAAQTAHLRELALEGLVDLPPTLDRIGDSAESAFQTLGDAALAAARDTENAADIMQSALSSMLSQFASTLLTIGAIDPAARAVSTALKSSFASDGAAAAINAFFAGGFAEGGSFVVPGSGSRDSVLTSMLTTPGERVTVSPEGRGGGAQLGGEAMLRVVLEDATGGTAVQHLAPLANAIANQAADTAMRRLMDGVGGRNRTMMRTFGIGKRR